MNPISLRRRTILNRTLLILVGTLVAFVAALALANRSEPPAAQAAGGYQGYAKFGLLNGEAPDPDHAQWSTILELRQGGSRRDPVVVISKAIDTASVDLELGWLTQKHLPLVQLHLIGPGPQGYPGSFYEIRLKDVVIDDYQMAGGEGWPLEEVRLRFVKYSVRYRTFTPSGLGWNPWIDADWVNY